MGLGSGQLGMYLAVIYEIIKCGKGLGSPNDCSLAKDGWSCKI